MIDARALSLANISSTAELKQNLIEAIEANNVTHAALRDLLLHLAAKYLYEAKATNGYAMNPVANFHLRNGAQLYRLNWNADLSARGIQNSLGIMVNYKYNLGTVPSNSAMYINEKAIDAHEQVLSLL